MHFRHQHSARFGILKKTQGSLLIHDPFGELPSRTKHTCTISARQVPAKNNSKTTITTSQTSRALHGSSRLDSASTLLMYTYSYAEQRLLDSHHARSPGPAGLSKSLKNKKSHESRPACEPLATSAVSHPSAASAACAGSQLPTTSAASAACAGYLHDLCPPVRNQDEVPCFFQDTHL